MKHINGEKIQNTIYNLTLYKVNHYYYFAVKPMCVREVCSYCNNMCEDTYIKSCSSKTLSNICCSFLIISICPIIPHKFFH